MALNDKELQIVEAGKTAGKSKQDITNALVRYRQEFGVAPQAPVEPKSFLADAAEDFTDIGKDAVEEFDAAGKKIIKTAQDTDKSLLNKVLSIGSEAFKRGGRFIGKTLINSAKIAVPEEIEMKLADAAKATGAGVVKYTQDFYKNLQESDNPDDQKVATMIGSAIEKYKTDPAFKEQVDNVGGFTEGILEIVGGGTAIKTGKEAVEQGVKGAARVRELTPDLNIPYFQEGEKVVADAIERMKKTDAESAEKFTADRQAVDNFKQKLINQVTVNVDAGTDVSAITTRLDELIEQGKVKEAVKEAADFAKTPGILSTFSEKMLDTAVAAVEGITNTSRRVKESSTRRFAESLDRKALRDTENMTPEQTDRYIEDAYVNAVSPGVKGKKQTPEGIEKSKKSAVAAVKEMITNKGRLKFRDTESNQDITGELPSNLWEFGSAIESEKKEVWKEIAAAYKQTGNGPVDTQRVVDKMDEVIDDPVFKGETAIINRAKQIKEKLELEEFDIDQIERILQIENDRLQAYYRGNGTLADSIVSAIVANNLRDILDETVESATGAGVSELKAKYGNLKSIERDVVHRALHNDQARKAGMVDMFNVRSIGDVASVATGNVGALMQTAGQIAGEAFIKAVNDRDDLIRRMFLVADERAARQATQSTE